MSAQPTVLLVEDDNLLRDALETTLRRRGYRVLSAADGNDAVAAAKKQTPQIAVLDMMLPGQSGFQIAQQLKEMSNGRVFVVMMSGNSSSAHRDYAFASGVDRFLAKPFATSKLLEAIEGIAPSMRAVPA